MFEGLACIFEGPPSHFQQKPLLGIHAHRFPGRNAKKGRIELIDALYKTAVAHMLSERMARVRVVVEIQIPAVGGNLCDRLTTFP